ncbi:hypothetical protein PENSPDRAFT_418963 [Peniophora sp. CONT]|nr:hypothetical protein PENSPDRAFT_418963 [Peniophora sp. CONT]
MRPRRFDESFEAFRFWNAHAWCTVHWRPAMRCSLPKDLPSRLPLGITVPLQVQIQRLMLCIWRSTPNLLLACQVPYTIAGLIRLPSSLSYVAFLIHTVNTELVPYRCM